MFMSEEQISQPSLGLKFKVTRFCILKWILKAVEVKRMLMHKECKCEEFCLQTRLVVEIYSSDKVKHKGHYQFYMDNTCKNFLFYFFKHKFIAVLRKQKKWDQVVSFIKNVFCLIGNFFSYSWSIVWLELVAPSNLGSYTVVV